jgi:hypothetical protein
LRESGLAKSSVARHTQWAVSYALELLGWLQFQQLCAQVLELDADVPQGAWEGDADDCRFVRVESGLGPSLLGSKLPGPTLVQCMWIRPGTRAPGVGAVDCLTVQQPDELRELRSYVLMANGDVAAPRLGPNVVSEHLRVEVVGTVELGTRIDACPELRLAMPSLLGLRELDELIPPGAAKRSSFDRRDAEQLAEVFVPTHAHQRALAILAENRFAVLTGPPEMGKTAMARMIALAKLTDGWEVHECTSPEEVWPALDPAVPQVFIADDAFGSTEYRADAAERWARAMERLLRSLDDRHWLIWTSRPAPLHAALRRLHRERGAERFPAPARVLVDAGDLDASEKALILFRHAKAARLPDSIRRQLRVLGAAIVENRHFTPERIRRLSRALSRGQWDVGTAMRTELTTATGAMATSFGTLADEHRDLLVALLDTPPGPVPERELVAALRRHHDGSLSHPPAELVDRLADHFLRVLA